jgi:hypothetical protein
LLLAGALSAQTPDSRPANSYATAVGTPLHAILVFGDPYNGGDELYDARITVTEIVRGEKAWQMVTAASPTNTSPPAAMEYLLARVKFEFSARVRPEHYTYTLNPAQFSAMSSASAPYAKATLAASVQPELRATLRSGDSADAWVAFLVPRGDHTPLMLFREDVGSIIHEGSGSIFKLYDEKPPAPRRAKAR